jgi:hypothetical protein
MANTLNASTSAGLVQTADTSGTIELQSAGATKLTVGSTGTSIAQYNPAASLITSGTAVSVSGTSIPFTSIPSWVKRISVIFNAIGTNGSSNFLIQVGTGGTATTSGYLSTSTRVWSSVNVYNSTAGFIYGIDNSSMTMSGIVTIANISGNTWVASGVLAQTEAGGTTMSMQGGGTVTLSGVLNYLRLTTVNGTDTFDAGTINILYE